MTRFLKMSGVTPCRVGRLTRSVAILAVFLAPSLASAATISGGVDERGHHYLSLDGSIAPGDPEKLAAAIFEANARGYQLDALRLNSPGGPIWEAMAMAVMIRWVQNMATIVKKDAKCESACFGLFAAGYRKYVDPASDPTQIGVHSIYAVIKQQEGAPVLFWRESEETTIWAVRRLKTIGVSESIIGKIVTTSPDQMTYLTIGDLRLMGVEVNGHLLPPMEEKPPAADTIFLSPAVARVDIRLDNGTVIPRDMVVVTISDVSTTDAPILCFSHPMGVRLATPLAGATSVIASLAGRSWRPRRWPKIH